LKLVIPNLRSEGTQERDLTSACSVCGIFGWVSGACGGWDWDPLYATATRRSRKVPSWTRQRVPSGWHQPAAARFGSAALTSPLPAITVILLLKKFARPPHLEGDWEAGANPALPRNCKRGHGTGPLEFSGKARGKIE